MSPLTEAHSSHPNFGPPLHSCWEPNSIILQPITRNLMAFSPTFEISLASLPVKPKLDQGVAMGAPMNLNSTQRGPGLLHC